MKLDRNLGIAETLSIVIGRIIGSGIFRTPAPILLITGSVSLFFGAWLVGAVATVLGAILYAEMVAMLPKTGGPYAYLKEAYPPVWSFLRGWAMFFVSETGAIAAVALVFAEYFGVILTESSLVKIGTFHVLFLALFLVWMMTLLNSLGLFLSGILQDIFSGLKLLALLGIVVVCFYFQGNWDHFSYSARPMGLDIATFLALGAAMRYSFFAYSGWEGATYVAEEVKNPSKNLPLSILLGIGLVLVVYFLVNAAYIYQLDPRLMAESKAVASDALLSAVGPVGAAVVAFVIVVNTAGNVNTQIMVKARTWYAMARDGLFFSPFAHTSKRFQTPNGALIGQAIWASVLVSVAAFQEDAYKTVIDFFSGVSAIFNISTFVAVWILRKKLPTADRPFRAPALPFILGIVLFIHGAFLVATLITAFTSAMIGIALTSTGLVYYYLIQRRREG